MPAQRAKIGFAPSNGVTTAPKLQLASAPGAADNRAAPMPARNILPHEHMVIRPQAPRPRGSSVIIFRFGTYDFHIMRWPVRITLVVEWRGNRPAKPRHRLRDAGVASLRLRPGPDQSDQKRALVAHVDPAQARPIGRGNPLPAQAGVVPRANVETYTREPEVWVPEMRVCGGCGWGES